MNEQTIKTALVDLLDTLLGAGTTARLLAEDLRVATPGCGFDETRHRKLVRNLVGSTPDAVAAMLDSLVGTVGTSGTLTRTPGPDAIYTVS
jgi:hypothetical protein